MEKKVETGENIGKPWVRLQHHSLERVNETSPYRSWCPVCKQGIMLVQRAGPYLLRSDHCSLCGQRFIYEDDEIAGQPLNPPLAELDAAMKNEVTTTSRTRFNRIIGE